MTDHWRSRPFGEGTSARHVIAERMARREHFTDIPPAIWAEAGATVEALRQAGFRLRRSRDEAVKVEATR